MNQLTDGDNRTNCQNASSTIKILICNDLIQIRFKRARDEAATKNMLSEWWRGEEVGNKGGRREGGFGSFQWEKSRKKARKKGCELGAVCCCHTAAWLSINIPHRFFALGVLNWSIFEANFWDTREKPGQRIREDGRLRIDQLYFAQKRSSELKVTFQSPSISPSPMCAWEKSLRTKTIVEERDSILKLWVWFDVLRVEIQGVGLEQVNYY